MKTSQLKLYCYVDETGQDTKGELFIVSVIITKEDRADIIKTLEEIERNSGKGKTKWVKTKKEFKIAYLERIITNKLFKHKIFYSLSKETKAYKELTLISIASAITAAKDTEEYKASIFIDGLYKSEIPKMGAGLRKIGIHTEKVRGIKDEADAIIRLADTISGLMREDYQGVDYAKKLSLLGRKNKTLLQV
ncbi:MAG: DUF3800 domain-containing protein [Patescibacteria group bacterium]